MLQFKFVLGNPACIWEGRHIFRANVHATTPFCRSIGITLVGRTRPRGRIALQRVLARLRQDTSVPRLHDRRASALYPPPGGREGRCCGGAALAAEEEGAVR